MRGLAGPWRSTRIRFRLVVMAAVPLGALNCFAVSSAAGYWSTLQAAQTMRHDAQVAAEAGQLVHATQVERGLSTAYSASRGTRFAGDLAPARTEVDQHLAGLRRLLTGSAHGGTVNQEMAEALSGYDGLAATRARVDKLTVPTEIGDAYTAMIADLFDGFDSLVESAEDPTISHEMSGFVLLNLAKEALGQERAAVARGTTGGGFSASDRNEAHEDRVRYQAFAEAFTTAMPHELTQTWEDFVTQRAFTDVVAVEDLAINVGTVPEADRWWQVATARIDAVHQYTLGLSDQIAGEASDAASRAQRAFVISLLTLAGILAAVALLSVAITRSMTGPLQDHSSLLASASEQLASVSTLMTHSSADASAKARAVAAASDQMSANIHTVAAAANELSHSFDDVARSANEAATIAASGANVAQGASQIVADLSASSKEISGVVALISSIAQQTNLLALNATIEAAGAGPAGKGFAVVASEVKDLAHQVSRATAEISDQVAAIQANAAAATDAITSVTEVMARVSQTQDTIAIAVRDQIAATNDIDATVQDAAQHTDQISQTINALASETEEFSRGADETRDAARSLAATAHALTQLVG